MLFSSLVFLLMFLPLTLIIYFIIGHRFRNIFLLIASLFFYAWGEPSFVIVMVASIVINYTFGRLTVLAWGGAFRKTFLILGISANLALLIYFKYFSFLFLEITTLFHIEATYDIFKNIVLPIGISFFTFQGMSYLIDIYRGDSKVQKNFINMALYIALFPQLIAGPIVRYNTIESQLNHRYIKLADFSDGLRIFMIGLGKKVMLANSLGFVADSVFNMPIAQIDSPSAWLGILCYTLQIYFDFSGYSEMAIGIGKMLGFTFPVNFNYPYISKNMTEFWRRWHISLSTWFKDYLYIPLGGNRVSQNRTYINLFIVFALTGLWHGANWTFLLWGLWHGLFLIIEKFLNVKEWKYTPFKNVIGHLYTIFVFMFGWILFRSDNISYAIEYVKTMFTKHPEITLSNFLYLTNKQTIFFLILGILASTPLFKNVLEKKYLGIVLALVIYLISLITLANSTYNPFIYFRF